MSSREITVPPSSVVSRTSLSWFRSLLLNIYWFLIFSQCRRCGDCETIQVFDVGVVSRGVFDDNSVTVCAAVESVVGFLVT